MRLPDKIAERETWAAENRERAEAMVRDVLNGKPPQSSHRENGNVVYLHDEEGPGHDAA